MPSEMYRQLAEQGFAGPVSVLSQEQCRRFLCVPQDPRRQPPLDWPKGHAASSRAFYEIATHPTILSIVEELLGKNVMLFGASLLTQRVGAVHPWHSDIETSGPIGKTVSVWIGLENISVESALQFISYSHRFGATVQEVRAQFGKARHEATTDNVVSWATQRDPRAKLVIPEMTTGQALFFQGQAWHHSDNRCGQTRRALLLQYATPETPIRMPDPNNLDWPFKQREFPRPACIMIRGTDNTGINRIVPAPVPAAQGATSQLTNQICPLTLPLAPDDKAGYRFHSMFSGSTPDLHEMEVHASVLNHSQCPHPPHTHKEEEILILLSGAADLLLPNVKGMYGDERHPLRPGEFVYYPANFPHTLRTTSAEPANYLMFKWHANPTGEKTPLGFAQFSTFDPTAAESGPGFRSRIIFEGPTGCLRKLHCHVSVLEPGAGYAPHADAHDVAILVLEGEVETLDQRVAAHTTIYHPAGQMHGLRNPGSVRARYIVFEFHGSQSGKSEAFPTPPATMMEKITDPQRWKRKIKHVLKRLKSK